MSDLNPSIYQIIWSADQEGNGVRPILSSDTTTPRDTEQGYVVVDWPEVNDKDHKVLKEAIIPDKEGTYEKCKALFDNYELKSSETEVVTIKEDDEINDFVNAIKDTSPMKIAREYLNPDQTDDEWFNSIKEKWFTIFGAQGRSGMEHVLVGENSGRRQDNIGGYHFWYKYYLDDGEGKLSGKDTIDFVSNKLPIEGRSVPEVVTLGFKWNPEERVLSKSIGGFWVGCSPEGLMALGMARWKQKTIGKTEAEINGALYEIVLYTDVDRRRPENRFRTDDKYINTFWPKFLGVVTRLPERPEPEPELPEEPEEPVSRSSSIRIIAALVNPVGNDVGFETVTLINISNVAVSMNGWSIIDKNGNGSGLLMQLKAGEVQTVTLSGAARTAQLGNKGGTINLVDRRGLLIDNVSYSRNEVREQGVTLLF